MLRLAIILALLITTSASAQQLCINITGLDQARVEKALAANHGYRETVQTPDGRYIANPRSRADFLRTALREWVLDNLRVYAATEGGRP